MLGSKLNRTVIAEGLKIIGSVTAEGLVEVNGQIEGELHCASLITLERRRLLESLRRSG
jgi:cytoskeletal protein CcmA (bactofilin family)